VQPGSIDRIQRLLRFLDSNERTLVVDADVHATDTQRLPRRPVDSYYHGRPVSAEDVIAEMDLAGVQMANIWQNPASTHYPGSEDANAEALLEANRYIFSCAQRHPERFIASGWTDPKACGVSNARRIAEICVREFGFLLVKMNPAQNAYPIDAPEVLEVADRIVELGAVPVFHYGADTPFTPASGLEALAVRYSGWPVVAVHMGGGGAGYLEAERLYQESRELGLRRPNIRFILSAMRDAHIEEALVAYQLAGPPFSENLFCGSDAPYGRMSWNFGGFRAMFEGLQRSATHTDARVRSNPGLFTADSAQAYLGGNFARFLAAAYARLLSIQRAATA
jgi:predicted TIM-barrel fold metal-dependent hydrolase